MIEYKKISELAVASTVSAEDLLEIVQSGVSKRATFTAVKAHVTVEEPSLKTADFTIGDNGADSNVFEVTPTAATITVTLPDRVTNLGRSITINMYGTAAGVTSIVPAGADTIEGESAITLDSQYNYLTVVALSGSWIIIDYISSGSNANGEYVRFSEGLQICRVPFGATTAAIALASGSLGNYRNGGGTWTGSWPAAFKTGTVPQVFTAGSTVGMSSITVQAVTTSATVWSLLAWAGASQGAANRSADILAIGAWK